MQTNVVQAAREVRDATVDQEPAGREAARLLAAVRDLAPMIAARAEEIERGRRIPQDIVDAIRASGAYRMLVPRSHGGLGLSIPDALPILEALSAADGSVGWVMMVAADTQLFCTRLPRAVYDKVFGNGGDAIVAGSSTPAGRAEKTAGGYRVTGRWPFASGCQIAQWIAGNCMVWEDGKPAMAGDAPVIRLIIHPADRWRIEETWRASGLAGTGSHHVALDQAEIPESETCDVLHDPSCVPGPFEAAFRPFLPITHAAVAVGIATGALADIIAVANGGKRQLFAASDLRDSTIFHHELGRASADLRAAQALLEVQAAALWRRAVAGTLDNNADFTEALQASAWIHAACAGFVDRCYELAGSAVATASPLERRLRDIHLAGQHASAGARFYARAGAQHLGFPPVDPLSGR